MDLVFRKVFSEHRRILLAARHSNVCLEWRSWLSSKSLISCTSMRPSNEADSGQNKDDREKEDPFKLLLNNLSLQKKTPSVKNSSVCPSLQLPTKQSLGEHKLIENYFYEEFINSSDLNNTSKIIIGLSENLHLQSSEQLINIIRHSQTLSNESASLKQLTPLLNQLDKECCLRSSNWKRNIYLQAAWHFFQLKSSNFLLQKKAASELAGQVGQMTPQELVSYLTIVKQFRKFPDQIDKEKLEKRIYQVIGSLTIEDLGIVCLAFFECKFGIQNQELVGRMAERLLASATSTDDKTVGSMLKLFRKSSNDTARYAKEVLDLQPRLYDQIPEWGPKVLIQLVAVGSNLLYFHLPTIERVVEKFLTCMSEARLKDLERLAMAVAISGHQSTNSDRFWYALENEFNKEDRRQEISRYPNAFISLVNYAVIANHYLDKLLLMVFNPDFVECAKAFSERASYNSTKRELLSLDCSLSIEKPDYDGPRLSSEDAHAFEKLYRKPIPIKNGRQKLSNHDAFLLSLLETTQEFLGKNNSPALVYLQPHFAAPDIVFSLKNRGKENSQSPENGIGAQHYALVGGSRNMYSKFTNQPMGPLRMKIRQLQAMGYHVISIPWYDFLLNSQSNRLDFLSQKIHSEMKTKTVRNR